MGLEVIYGGCKDDKLSRELVVTARGDKLVVRKIFRNEQKLGEEYRFKNELFG